MAYESNEFEIPDFNDNIFDFPNSVEYSRSIRRPSIKLGFNTYFHLHLIFNYLTFNLNILCNSFNQFLNYYLMLYLKYYDLLLLLTIKLLVLQRPMLNCDTAA